VETRPIEPPPRLPEEGLLRGRDGAYLPDPGLVRAANVALAIGAPLLLTGEAGCGKTDFAWAASHQLTGEAPLACFVRSDTRARDLLYYFDAVRRFGDAQVAAIDPAARERARDPRSYVALRGLGEALVSPRLRVVLVDEIDKAPRDLPNDLLLELDAFRFEIPELPDAPLARGPVDPGRRATWRREMQGPGRDARPLVIITSNVERQLPEPFLRRCVFFHIEFPDGERLAEILRARFRDGDPPDLYSRRAIEACRALDARRQAELFGDALKLFQALRDQERQDLLKRPGTAELLAWVRALLTGAGPVDAALRRLRDAAAPARVDWSCVPAMGCLIKLREDRGALGLAR